jgi:hypothetical protein
VDRYGERFDPTHTLQKYPKKLMRLEDWVQATIMTNQNQQAISAGA